LSYPELGSKDWYDLWSPFLDHFQGKKRRLYEVALTHLEKVNFHCSEFKLDNIDIKVKCDESLLKCDGAQEFLNRSCKPRIIMPVCTEFQIIIGPFLNLLAEYMKFQWFPENARTFTCLGRNYSLFYAPGHTVSDISEWFNKSLHAVETLSIAAGGDDSLVVICLGGKVLIYEGDASQFDATQSLGPLQMECLVLERLGLSTSIIAQLKRTFSANLVARVQHKKLRSCKLKVTRRKRPMRNTGGPDTTFGNTLIMLLASMFAYSRAIDIEAVERAYAFLGLRMKLHVFDEPEACSFLKGWFTLDFTLQRYHWNPLPSRILKMGKSLRNPQDIYPNTSASVAAKMFMNDVSYGINSMTISPIIQTFCKQFVYSSCFVEHMPEWFYLLQEGSAKITLSADNCERAFCLRYCMSSTDYRDFMKFLSEIVLNSFNSHPVAYQMALRDYG
jgi:hypothetical protein